jgi:cytochrome c oxidase subunit IV
MGHVAPKSLYYLIFGALMVFTVITVEVATHNFGVLNFPVAIGIAITKATLVILFFMHAKYSSKLTKLFVGTAFFFLAILLGLTMTDYLSRGLDTYPGGSAGAGYSVRQPRPPAVLKVDEGESHEGGAEGKSEGAVAPAH